MIFWKRRDGLARDALGWWIVGACALMYALSAAAGIFQAEPGADWVSYIFEPPTDALVTLGIGGSIPLRQLDIWSLVAANYLHSDIFHIGLNSLALIQIMPTVVRQFGRGRSFIIYTLAGIASSLASAGSGEYYSLGASGCILGLFGAQLGYAMRVGGARGWTPVKRDIPWVLLTLAVGFANPDLISNASHIGGLAGGFIVSLLLGAGQETWRPATTRHACTASLAVTAAGLLAGIANASWVTYLANDDRPAYAALIETHREAELNEQIRRKPDDDALLYARGTQAAQHGDLQAALIDFDRAATIRRSPENLHAKANALYLMERYPQAIAVYGTIIESNPVDITARLYRAGAFRRMGKADDALPDYRAIVDQQPVDAQGYGIRGTAFSMLGELDKALADYDAAIEADASMVNIYVDRAGVRLRTGDNAGAFADFDEAIRRAPQNYSIYGFRAGAYSTMKDYDKAIGDYDTVIAKGAPDAETWNGRAWALFNAGRQTEALQDVEKSLALSPDYVAALDTRGHVFEALGERDKAIADYRAALARDPSQAVTRDALNRLVAE